MTDDESRRDRARARHAPTPEEQERWANRRLHEAVLRYAHEQRDYAGSWWAESEGAMVPVVAFSGDLENHRRRIGSIPQAPGLYLVSRRHSVAELRAAARRAAAVRLEGGAVVRATSVDEQTGMPVVHIEGELTADDRRRLAKAIGLEPRVVPGTSVRRLPRRPPA